MTRDYTPEDEALDVLSKLVSAKTLPVTIRRKHYEVPIPVHLHIVALRDHIAALEAEKAERDAQEPVAWVLFDDIFIAPKDMQDDPPNLECMKPLYAHPLALREPTEDECSRIAIEAGHRLKTEAARIAIGRAMWQAVREVMTK